MGESSQTTGTAWERRNSGAPAWAYVPNGLVVEEERDERRQLSNLLIGEQLLGRRAVDRHLVERLVLGVAHAVVRGVEVVVVGQRGEIGRHRAPDRVDDLAVRLVQDRDAVRDLVAQSERILLPQHLLEWIRVRPLELLLDLRR